MANFLDPLIVETIYALWCLGWSQRRIACELGIDRETVGRYLRERATPANGVKSDSVSPAVPTVPAYKARRHCPLVELVPLPSCAQFLNVIESVFSGLAKAIIHNSDYESLVACQAAIDRYFRERNEFFQANPKRAGKKIWGKENTPSEFSPSNNCKNPNYHYLGV